MNGSFAETSPISSSDYADDALCHAIAAMHPGWIALRGCVLDAGDAAPARVRYALLHPRVGIALLDVVPGRTTPHAPDHLRRKLDAVKFHTEFGGTPPIVYFCMPARTLSDVGYLLEQEFSRQPASAPPRGDAWVIAAQAVLSAQPLKPTRQLAGRAGNRPARRAHQPWQQPARRFGGARLAAFWGLVMLTAGGGALFLQWLGSPETAQAAAPLLAAKAETSPGPPVAADRVLSPTTDAPGPVGADLQHTLAENDQAILELQSRLKGPRPDAGPGMATRAVLTDATLPGAAAERGMGTAIHAVDVAQAEAALRQLRADAEAARKQLADRNAQVERAGQRATAAEQQLAALQRQAEDARAAGAAVGKQLVDIQAQLRQLEDRRSAAEQQLNSLQAQADRTQGDRAVVEQQVAAGKAQLAQITEQQAKMLAVQAGRGRQDAADAETRLTEPREPVDPAVAQQAAIGEPLNAVPSKPSSTGQAAVPVEAAPAVLEYPGSVVPASAAAGLAASHAGAPSEAASFVPVLPASRAPDPVSAALAEMMVRRGDALLQQGDVSAARLLYDRAASAGSAHAATAMGRTFDAMVLAGIGAVGLGPDPALAALWYHRGLSLGDEEARTWLQSLPPTASHVAAQAERP